MIIKFLFISRKSGVKFSISKSLPPSTPVSPVSIIPPLLHFPVSTAAIGILVPFNQLISFKLFTFIFITELMQLHVSLPRIQQPTSDPILSQTIQPKPSHPLLLRAILILSSYLSQSLACCLFPSCAPLKPVCISLLSHACNIPCPSHSSDNRSGILSAVQIVKRHIMLSPTLPFYFIPLWLLYRP